MLRICSGTSEQSRIAPGVAGAPPLGTSASCWTALGEGDRSLGLHSDRSHELGVLAGSRRDHSQPQERDALAPHPLGQEYVLAEVAPPNLVYLQASGLVALHC